MRIVNILFSPTGGTRKAAEKLMENWGTETETLDLMTYEADFSGEKFPEYRDRELPVFCSVSTATVLTMIHWQRWKIWRRNAAFR